MTDLATATILAGLILTASIVSVEFGISVAIIEIGLGVVGASVFGLRPTPWIDFIGSFAGIVLTFLAGAEVDQKLLRREWKPAVDCRRDCEGRGRGIRAATAHHRRAIAVTRVFRTVARPDPPASCRAARP